MAAIIDLLYEVYQGIIHLMFYIVRRINMGAVLWYAANKAEYPFNACGAENADCGGESGITGSAAICIQKTDAGII